jgi:hypothetical protein
LLLINSTGNTYLFRLGSQDLLILPANGQLETTDELYSGNETFKNQVDSLYRTGQIEVVGFESEHPESGNLEEIVYPATYDVSDKDLILYADDAAAGVALNEAEDGTTFGYIRLESETGTKVGVTSHSEGDDGGVFFADKNQNDAQKFFDLRVQNEPLEINPATITTEQLADFLIELGLAVEA